MVKDELEGKASAINNFYDNLFFTHGDHSIIKYIIAQLTDPPLVSVVILNYNGLAMIRKCLDSVLASDYKNLMVIIVDNGSKGKEKKILKKWEQKRIKVVSLPENRGFAEGNNIGSRYTKGKYILFLNNDAILSRFCLRKIITRFEKDPRIAFIQPKVKSLQDKNFFEYAGGAGGFLDYFGYPFVRGRIFGHLEEDVGQYDDEREIFWASGVALFCRREIFEKLGGFDPIFFAYAEEDDLCFRAHRAGYKLIYYPKAQVYHFGGYTSNRDVVKKIFLIHRNHLILLLKNLKIPQLAFILPIRAMMDLGTLLYYLLYYRNPKTAFIIAVSYLSLLRNLPGILRARLIDKIGNFGYPRKSGLVYNGSIAFAYFIFGKRRWIEIIKQQSVQSRLKRIF